MIKYLVLGFIYFSLGYYACTVDRPIDVGGNIDPGHDFGAICDGTHDDRRAVFLATQLAQRLNLTITPCPMGPSKLDDSIKLDGAP